MATIPCNKMSWTPILIFSAWNFVLFECMRFFAVLHLIKLGELWVSIEWNSDEAGDGKGTESIATITIETV